MSKIESLLQALDTTSDRVAEKGIARLVKLGGPAVPALLAAAKNGAEPRIQKWSLQALGAIGDRRAAPLLLGALGDERMTVRLHALRGLARLGLPRTALAVARLLRDPSGGIRVNALYTLIALGSRAVAKAIPPLLADPQWYVRQTACTACGRLRISAAGPRLRRLAETDERKAVRAAAAEALRSLQPGKKSGQNVDRAGDKNRAQNR